MVKTIIGKILFIFCICILSGCSGENCIDPDDFGAHNFTVSSRYDKKELQELSRGVQVAPWLDSGLRVNGDTLMIVVRGWDYKEDQNIDGILSAWCPWYGTEHDKYVLSRLCERLRTCTFVSDKMCPSSVKNKKSAPLNNPPCVMKKGVGAYGLIGERVCMSGDCDTNPNDNMETMIMPNGINFHLGEKHDYQIWEISQSGRFREAGGIRYKYKDGEDKKYFRSKLYFKILDKYYGDNSGAYRVSIKYGIEDTNPDPITIVVNLVKEYLFGAGHAKGLAQSFYENIVNKPAYKSIVFWLLNFYIIFTVLGYFAGNINLTQSEFVTRLMKLTIVSILLNSKYSWSFFHDYLFVFFIDGAGELQRIINHAGQIGSGSSSIIALMLAKQTIIKLFSLLFKDWLGWLYIILFIVALYFILIVTFRAAVLYMTALFAISVLIILGPIFICFMLFSFTKRWFDNWLKQLVSYSIQPIILFTGLTFMSTIISQEIYGSLGFGVCRTSFISGNFYNDKSQKEDNASTNSLFSWWFPNPKNASDFLKHTVKILVPITYYDEEKKEYCAPYACEQERYPDLPYLDPKKDGKRIKDFHDGKYVQLEHLFIIFVAIYLLNKFNSTAVSISRFIGDTDTSKTMLSNIASDTAAGLQRNAVDGASWIGNKILKRVNLDHPIDRMKALGMGVAGALGKVALKTLRIDKAIDKMQNWWEKKKEAKMNEIRNEALGNGAKKFILDEVARKTGMRKQDINKNAMMEYKNGIKDVIKKMNSTNHRNMSEEEIDKLATSYSQKSYGNLKNALARDMVKGFSGNYNQLKRSDKDKLDALLKDNSLNIAALEAKRARLFQEEYLAAHQRLSEKGIGVLGKRNPLIRGIQEINNDVKEKHKIEKNKLINKAEKHLARYEFAKSIPFFGQTAFSNINHENQRTYDEQLKDEAKEIKQREFEINLEKRDNLAGKSVLDSIIGDAKFREYLSNKYYLELTKNGALPGKEYMKSLSKEEKLETISKMALVKRKFLSDDKLIGKKEYFEMELGSMNKKLDKDAEKLKNYYHNMKDHEISKNLKNYREFCLNTDMDKNIVEQRKLLKKYYPNISNIDRLKDREIKKYLQEYHKKKINDDKKLNLSRKRELFLEDVDNLYSNDRDKFGKLLNASNNLDKDFFKRSKEDQSEFLKEHYGEENFNNNSFKNTLENYRKEIGDNNEKLREKFVKDLKNYNDSLNEYTKYQKSLEEIVNREKFIEDETSKYIEEIIQAGSTVSRLRNRLFKNDGKQIDEMREKTKVKIFDENKFTNIGLSDVEIDEEIKKLEKESEELINQNEANFNDYDSDNSESVSKTDSNYGKSARENDLDYNVEDSDNDGSKSEGNNSNGRNPRDVSQTNENAVEKLDIQRNDFKNGTLDNSEKNNKSVSNIKAPDHNKDHLEKIDISKKNKRSVSMVERSDSNKLKNS